MPKKIFCSVWIMAILLAFAMPLYAGMQSQHYRISASVLSGGEGSLNSASYHTTFTLAQPSPLMDLNAPPHSSSFYIYPGWWYVLTEYQFGPNAMPWLYLLLSD